MKFIQAYYQTANELTSHIELEFCLDLKVKYYKKSYLVCYLFNVKT
jgi:hypothetical protein